MNFYTTTIKDVFLVKTIQNRDSRGFFHETFRKDIFQKNICSSVNFVQDNYSFTKQKGTIRGLHCQAPPVDQGKLIRCESGSILDIVVDVRPKSPTFKKHFKAKLSSKNRHQLWVPSGCLHGFMSLTNNCGVAYKVTQYYSRESECNVLWNDPELGIDWGISEKDATISDKDKAATLFADWTNPF